VPRESATDRPSIWPWAVLGLFGALGCGWLGGWWASREVRAELALRPPALVLDLAAAARGAAPQAVDAALARQLATARQLAAGGFLVFDAQAVLAAPSQLTVTPPGAIGETKR
jgi:hypothetical protein